MKYCHKPLRPLVILLLLAFSYGCVGSEHDTHGGHGDHHGHDHHVHDEPAGPHGGRLFQHHSFAAELATFEADIPPEFRAYFYENEKPIPPEDVRLELTLTRLDSPPEVFSFETIDDYLRSEQVVSEPHSFEVAISATYKGTRSEWEYSTEEARTKLSEDVVRASGLEIEVAGPRTIPVSLTLNGRIVPNADTLAHITPRFPGIVTKIFKTEGDTVNVGEVLAEVESNESLRTYPVTSLVKGSVVDKHTFRGESLWIKTKRSLLSPISLWCGPISHFSHRTIVE